MYLGAQATPLIIIDELCNEPHSLVDFACQHASETFCHDAKDFYPGLRKALPPQYASDIGQHYLSLIKETFSLSQASTVTTVLSALSIAATPEHQLRPIQTLPHFDSPRPNQLAIVHYLCDANHGGTSFYRHRSTEFETITNERLPEYGALLKQQAIAAKLHQNLHYMAGDNALFERIAQVDAKFNRAIIYPSNLLHSGDIQAQLGLSSSPRQGRLTTSSFIRVC